MNDQFNDDLHDEQLSNLYQQSRIEEPPMALDSAILTEARKAVEKPEKKALWNRIGWVMPLASVAVAMLTVALFIQTKQEHPKVLDTGIMHDVAPMEESILHKEDVAEPLMDREMRVAPAPKPAKEVIEKKRISVPAIRLRSASPAPSSTTGAASHAPKAKRMLKMERQPMATQQFKSAPAPIQADSVESGLTNEASESLGAVQRSKQSQSETVSRAPVEMQIDIWLEHIRELIRSGKLDEAKESLEAFRKTHPNHPLPEDVTLALK